MVKLLALLFWGAFAWAFDENFYAIKEPSEKKEAFFSHLRPLVAHAQDNIAQERRFVLYYFYLKEHLWTNLQTEHTMTSLAHKYRIKAPYQLGHFLLKIDTVPTPLALAQAAVESGWGESYFVKEANNLYGEWTWGKKGIIPRNRDANMTHKIRIFENLQESVESYMLNLNRHYAYKKFRQIRAQRAAQGKPFLARDASHYLKSYSGLGEEYPKLLQKVIVENMLCEHNTTKP
ncbi:MAG: hypothetical protein KU37_02655 [Sulfuricurvum sp. PC08-66]|nr:MAG: hypothetical protein KU37_02655 [Sulfuricurvum sp. PC08-66]